MIPRFNDVVALIDHAFERYTDLPAFTCAGQTLSYREIDRLSRCFASYLQHEAGIKPGDRVAIQLPNVLQFPVVFYGVIRAGAVIVNANPLYTAREIKHQLNDSGARVLVVLSNIANNAAEIIGETPIEKVIVTNFADLHAQPKRWAMNFAIKHIKKMVPKFSFDNSIDFLEALNRGNRPLQKHNVDPEQILMLQYTGGTTGVSKGAMLTHNNMVSNVWQLMNHVPSAFEEGKEIFVTCLPLYHIYALNLHLLGSFCAGANNVLIPNPRDLPALVNAIKPYRFSVFVGINTLFTALCRFEPFKLLDFSSLKYTASGGMALTEGAANNWRDVTGNQICEGYGLTEASPVVSGNQHKNVQLGTVGIPVLDTEVKVIDEEGKTLASGEAGELLVRGPQVMKGYWNRPEETAKTIDEDGWLHTGDVAVIKEDKFIKIVDRKKDMIIVSGFNVYPNEIEDTVCLHPDIVEAAAVGVQDERCGEAVKLYVVRAREDLTVDEVKSFCRQYLTAYKNPRYIEFRDSLPKSNVGKILRKELRENRV